MRPLLYFSFSFIARSQLLFDASLRSAIRYMNSRHGTNILRGLLLDAIRLLIHGIIYHCHFMAF